jgi:hypothetical protein
MVAHADSNSSRKLAASDTEIRLGQRGWETPYPRGIRWGRTALLETSTRNPLPVCFGCKII